MPKKKYAYKGHEGTDRRRVRKGFTLEGEVRCKECVTLKSRNEELRTELVRLKSQLKQFQAPPLQPGLSADQSTAPHTPSSRIAYKKNASEVNQKKQGGAKPGHLGSGRVSACSSEVPKENVFELEILPKCPDCSVPLNRRDIRERTVVDTPQVKADQIVYRCRRGQCPKCRKVYMPRPPVLAKSMYGNSLIAQAAVMHYLYGVSIGRVVELLGDHVTQGGLIQAFHRLGNLFEPILPKLVEQYRQSAVKHADETGWRTNGNSGYAWLFCSEEVSLFEFRRTRSAQVAHEILGKESLSGVLVVDRYGGYNQMPCQLQYCFAHLLREIEKTEKDFIDQADVVQFSRQMAWAVSESMKLRNRDINDEDYYQEAKLLKEKIEALVAQPAKHLAIQGIQHLFRKNAHRLYHWVSDRRIPAENNRAERELRPTVIARKVSFGSQSEKGARTRSRIMTVLFTARKRLRQSPLEVEVWLKTLLDKISQNPSLDWYSFLPNARN